MMSAAVYQTDCLKNQMIHPQIGEPQGVAHRDAVRKKKLPPLGLWPRIILTPMVLCQSFHSTKAGLNLMCSSAFYCETERLNFIK